MSGWKARPTHHPMIPLPVFVCDGCGACCHAFPVFVSGEDAVREPRIAGEARRLADHLASPKWTFRLYPLPFLQACPFLDAASRCTIYATRPQVCRDFLAGSKQCQEARRRNGLAPLEGITDAAHA